MSLGLLAAGAARGQVLQLGEGAEAGSLRRGSVSVRAEVVSQGESDGIPVRAPRVTVRHNGRVVGRMVGLAKPGPPVGVVQIVELDPANPHPEVLLASYSGGAHCCQQIQVLRGDGAGGVWREVDLGPFNGGPAPARDPLGDGRFLIVASDDRFLYRFGCYVCGTAPLRLWQLQGERFVDVSHRPEFLPLHRRSLVDVAEWFRLKDPPDPNAFLAGYVAIKALVGEFDDGWRRMLQRYERGSDWGLRDCRGAVDGAGRCLGEEVVHRSFPEALRAFLLESGYLPSGPSAPSAPAP